MRRQLELSNEAAAALSGHADAILRALEGHVDCEVYLRGNLVTLEGDGPAVEAAATVVAELADLADGLTGADFKEVLRRLQLAKAMDEARGDVPVAPIGQADLIAGVAELRRSQAQAGRGGVSQPW